MIDGFETITYELTEYEEKTLLPKLIYGLKLKTGKKNEVTATHICKQFTDAGYKLSGARLRKIINHIRVNNLIFNLISTSKGYYIATTEAECKKYLLSLKQRIGAITSLYDAMENQLKETKK